MSAAPSVEAEYRTAVGKVDARPTTWADIIGNARAVSILRESIAAAKAEGRPMNHTLLYAPPGMGKTTLAQAIALDMDGAYHYLTPSSLETATDVLKILYVMNNERETTGKPCILLIDEIHMLGKASGSRSAIAQEDLYPLLDSWFFPHNLEGKTIVLTTGPQGISFTPRRNTMRAWPFTCLGATTDPGALSAPLRRRFHVSVELDPYTLEDITTMIVRAAARLTWSCQPDAAAALAAVSRLTPGTADSMLIAAHNRAVATGRPGIDLECAREVVERMNLYPLGLNATDLRVLQILARRIPSGVGQAEISRAAGISLGQFSALCEPYLRFLGFVEVLNRRVITPAGMLYLKQLGLTDDSRAEVRAMLAGKQA